MTGKHSDGGDVSNEYNPIVQLYLESLPFDSWGREFPYACRPSPGSCLSDKNILPSLHAET